MRVIAALGGLCLALTAPLVALGAPEDRERRGAVSKPPSTCFWEGPISTRRESTEGFDGRNFNFPEESATYWLARFDLPSGSELVLRGRYPHGRYMSLNAYSDGSPTDALSDIRIRADRGSRNPFRVGARRAVRDRSWTVSVIDESRPAGRANGEPRKRNTLYARPEGDAPIELVYRVYEPEPGRDLTGGTGLPKQELRAADGTSADGADACEAVNDPNREVTVQTVPAPLWQSARNSPGCDGETNPAYEPPRWERFFNLDYASLAVVTDCTDAGRRGRLAMQPELRGGFYSNRDSAYIYAHLAREFGPLLVVEGRLPRFARTYARPKRMPDPQLRWWSLCTGESRVTARTPDCLFDRELLERSGRNYTVVVSKREDRPSTARRRCGVAWLDWGERGDGAGDEGYGLLIMRNMLVSRRFKQAIQRVPRPTEERAVMGRYFPRSEYMTEDEYETEHPCRPGTRRDASRPRLAP